MCQILTNTPPQQDRVFQIWSSTARCDRTVYVPFRSEDSRCGATPLLLRDWVRVSKYIDYTAVSKNWTSLVGEKSYVELDINQIFRNGQIENCEENLEVWEMRLRSETWDWGTRESWRILAKLRYARSGATPLQQDCCVFQIWSNTAAATGLFTGHLVRKIPDVEQHRCYGTVYGSIGSEQEVNKLQIWSNTPIICWLIRSQDSTIQIWSNTATTGRCTGQLVSLCITSIFVFFSALPSSLSTRHRVHL